MNVFPIIPDSRRSCRGMTLVELSVVMMAALLIAGISLSLLTQQLGFQRMLNRQAFLLEDAPLINNLLSRLLGQVDSYRLYPDRASAAAGGMAVLEDSRAVVVSFRGPNNEFQFAMLAFEADADGVGRLGFYNRSGGTWPATPDWIISERARDAVFFIEEGVLRVRLTGPNDEEITYSGYLQS